MIPAHAMAPVTAQASPGRLSPSTSSTGVGESVKPAACAALAARRAGPSQNLDRGTIRPARQAVLHDDAQVCARLRERLQRRREHTRSVTNRRLPHLDARDFYRHCESCLREEALLAGHQRVRLIIPVPSLQ